MTTLRDHLPQESAREAFIRLFPYDFEPPASELGALFDLVWSDLAPVEHRYAIQGIVTHHLVRAYGHGSLERRKALVEALEALLPKPSYSCYSDTFVEVWGTDVGLPALGP
jgi:hypothetical protein